MTFKKIYTLSFLSLLLATSALSNAFANTTEGKLPENILKIMQQMKYQHSSWGLYVKDGETGHVLFDLNSNQMFLPASTTKLFSVAALLHAYGDDYRFRTPVYALGKIQEGKLDGNLVLIAQGDLTMGGRQSRAGQNHSDKIAFTKLDHIIANNIPGVILTAEDPLYALKELAKKVQEKGIKEINGDVLIDDRLFQITEKRDMILSPMMINENLIDFIINPKEIGTIANVSWRPNAQGYNVVNEVKTVSKEESLNVQISSDEFGKNFLIKGTIPVGQKDVIRTFAIKDPNHFAKVAFIQALRDEGIVINLKNDIVRNLPEQSSFKNMQPLAVWTSPPLSEYAKLILKVSHNLGADLIPLLLAIRKDETTFTEGMMELGKFIIEDVKIPSDAFVFIDGAGGDENRLTPKAEVQLLEYLKKLPADQFKIFYNSLPILGIDGSLADFGKSTRAVGKVRAKTGTGVSFNLATHHFFLTTQTLTGYIEGKNGHLLEFMVSVNNATMPEIHDIFPIFEDLSQIASIIYEQSGITTTSE